MDKITQALKVVGFTIFQVVKLIWSLPQLIAASLRARRKQDDLDSAEAERLDRLRNPSDYIGR